MNDALRKILIVGAGLGLVDRMASLFPEPVPTKPLTDADMQRLAAAEAKRARRAAKLNREPAHV